MLNPKSEGVLIMAKIILYINTNLKKYVIAIYFYLLEFYNMKLIDFSKVFLISNIIYKYKLKELCNCFFFSMLKSFRI